MGISMTNLKNTTSISPALATRIVGLAEKHYGFRVASFFKLAYLTSLRIDELLNTKFTDISVVDNKFLVINHKVRSCNSKSCYLLSNEAISVVQKLKADFPSDIFLFQSKNSNNRINAEPSPLSRQYLSQAMKAINEITRNKITMSQFRHEYTIKNNNLNKWPNS